MSALPAVRYHGKPQPIHLFATREYTPDEVTTLRVLQVYVWALVKVSPDLAPYVVKGRLLISPPPRAVEADEDDAPVLAKRKGRKGPTTVLIGFPLSRTSWSEADDPALSIREFGEWMQEDSTARPGLAIWEAALMHWAEAKDMPMTPVAFVGFKPLGVVG